MYVIIILIDYLFEMFLKKDASSAKNATFSKEVNARSVTLDGVVYDPSGTLTGGSRPQGEPILTQLQKLNDAKEELAQHKHQLRKIEQEIERSAEAAREYQVFKNKTFFLFK